MPTPGVETRQRILIGTLVVVAAVVGAYWLAAFNQGGKDVVPWVTDYELAAEKSRRTGKPLLINYTASWCPPCKRMKSNVYSSKELAERITDQFVPVKQDTDNVSPRENQLARRLGVWGIPVLVVISPEGEELGRFGGYIPEARLVKWFDSFEQAETGSSSTGVSS